MVIKSTHDTATLFNIPVQPAKQGLKVTDPGSFAALLQNHQPKQTTTSNYIPVGTIHVSMGAGGGGATGSSTTGSSGTSSSTTSSAGPSTPAPFSATFVNGAVVTAPDGSQTALNPMELATAPTAQQVAALLGGKVVQDNMSGGYSASAATLEISVPGSSVEINAGLAANLFANYGTAAGSQAWRIINQDLGRDPMSTGPVG